MIVLPRHLPHQLKMIRDVLGFGSPFIVWQLWSSPGLLSSLLSSFSKQGNLLLFLSKKKILLLFIGTTQLFVECQKQHSRSRQCRFKMNTNFIVNSGCDPVGSTVASDTRCRQVASCHWQKINEHIYCQLLKDKNKEKEAGMAH